MIIKIPFYRPNKRDDYIITIKPYGKIMVNGYDTGVSMRSDIEFFSLEYEDCKHEYICLKCGKKVNKKYE
jgi:hypothetical protein